jgi:hypothetical protein
MCSLARGIIYCMNTNSRVLVAFAIIWHVPWAYFPRRSTKRVATTSSGLALRGITIKLISATIVSRRRIRTYPRAHAASPFSHETRRVLQRQKIWVTASLRLLPLRRSRTHTYIRTIVQYNGAGEKLARKILYSVVGTVAETPVTSYKTEHSVPLGEKRKNFQQYLPIACVCVHQRGIASIAD